MRILFFDTETTGGGERDRLIALAIKERGLAEPVINALYKPPVPISIESMTVHHITEKMAADKPVFTEAPEYAGLKALLEGGDTVMVAHNAAFDTAMLAREGVVPTNVICTYKVARALDPHEVVERYQLQYLRYVLGLEVEATAHEAWGDVLVLEAVFERLFAKMLTKHGGEDAVLAEMIRISGEPVLFTTLRFGKYKGEKIVEVARKDRGYLEWLLREKRQSPAGEEDWIATLEHALAASARGSP
jgi:DNA polymerase III epsilon subunit-like protein